MESQTDTVAKIKVYESQIEQINSLLASDPNNQQYLDLKKNLSLAIDLTQKLLDAQITATGEKGNGNDEEGKSVFLRSNAVSQSQRSRQFEIGVNNHFFKKKMN